MVACGLFGRVFRRTMPKRAESARVYLLKVVKQFVRSAYYGCNVRGYAVLPGVGTSAMPVASVPSIKELHSPQFSRVFLPP